MTTNSYYKMYLIFFNTKCITKMFSLNNLKQINFKKDADDH